MARQITAPGKNDPPRDRSDPAIKLTIDEISDSAQHQSDRGREGADVGKFHERSVPATGKDDAGNHHSHKPAVKAHTAVPYKKDLPWRRQIAPQVVKDCISEASADQH